VVAAGEVPRSRLIVEALRAPIAALAADPGPVAGYLGDVP
jgi:hypothetical protein